MFLDKNKLNLYFFVESFIRQRKSTSPASQTSKTIAVRELQNTQNEQITSFPEGGEVTGG